MEWRKEPVEQHSGPRQPQWSEGRNQWNSTLDIASVEQWKYWWTHWGTMKQVESQGVVIIMWCFSPHFGLSPALPTDGKVPFIIWLTKQSWLLELCWADTWAAATRYPMRYHHIVPTMEWCYCTRKPLASIYSWVSEHSNWCSSQTVKMMLQQLKPFPQRHSCGEKHCSVYLASHILITTVTLTAVQCGYNCSTSWNQNKIIWIFNTNKMQNNCTCV